MKPQGVLLCLTLLIAPTLTANTRTCTVISNTGNTVVLQCAGIDHLQANEQVRLQTIKTKRLVTMPKGRE